jgi:hypothetical protein
VSLAELAKTLGVPGLVLGIWYLLEHARIKQAAVSEKQRNEVESKKADAMTVGFSSLATRIDTHHTADIQSHAELAAGLARIEGIAAGRQQQAAEDSQVKELPTEPKRRTPPKGVPAGARYHFARTATNGDD